MSKKSMKPVKVQWTLKDSLAAQKQGWDLFDAGERFEIEVVTEHPAGFDPGSDSVATAWIIQQALRGNKVCIKGLIMAGLIDPQWFAADLTHLVQHSMVIPMDTLKKPTKPCSKVAYREDGCEVPYVSGFPDDNWNNDFIQFARLLAELDDVSEDTMQVLCGSMDLTTDQIHEIFDRAQTCWGRIKRKTT